MTRAIEDLGFDSVWVGEHLLYRWEDRPARGPWEAWTLLAAIAASTTRIALGPLVACTNFHNPALLAKQAITIDELSGGRFVLGLGAGWNETEFRAFGIQLDYRVSRFEEAFEIVRRLVAGERVTFHGRFHEVEDAVLLPPPARRTPLMIGANAPRMLSIALPHVESWNTWHTHYGNTPDGFSQRNAEVSEAAERAGRDPATLERSACVLVSAGEDDGRPETSPPVEADRLAGHLRELEEAGADEAILVVAPITQESVRELARVLGAARSPS